MADAGICTWTVPELSSGTARTVDLTTPPRRRKNPNQLARGNRTYRDHQGTSQVQGPPVDFRSLQVTCGRMNRLQAATSDACLPWMHT